MPLPRAHDFFSWHLILVVDHVSGQILAAQLVPRPWADHAFNRLLDHFQFGGDDYDSLKPVTPIRTIRLQQRP